MNGQAQCRAALRHGSRSFALAAALLPGRVRRPATALYAFCRAADDLIDTAGDGPHGLAEVHRRLDAIYAGAACNPADARFAEVVAAVRLPRTLPAALAEGFAWDVAGRRYEDLPALEEYAMRVAGTVGLMMAVIMGVRSRAALAAAAELGCAMQLTNIARDVGEDAAAGRLYLPLAWLRAEGIDPDAWLAAPSFGPALARVVRRLLIEARLRYRRAEAGIAALPLGCRPAIRAAAGLYAAIGDQVERNGWDSVSARAVVPRRRQLRLLVSGLSGAGASRGPLGSPGHPLVEAAVPHPAIPPRGLVRRVDDRIGWTLELFSRLDRDRPDWNRSERGSLS